MSKKTESVVGKVRDAVDRIMPELESLHSFIHTNPETPLEEMKAAAALCEFLDGKGLQISRGLAGLPTSFRADAGPAGESTLTAV